MNRLRKEKVKNENSFKRKIFFFLKGNIKLKIPRKIKGRK